MTDPTPQTTTTRDEAGDFLHRLRAANVRRDAEYRAKTQGEPLPLLFRTTEFAGEVGELLNVVKKIERERLGWAGKRADRQMLLEEFGGVVATLDLLAMMLDVDLATATADEFNAVSDRLSLTTKLASAPAPASDPISNRRERKVAGYVLRGELEAIAAGKKRWTHLFGDKLDGDVAVYVPALASASGGADAVAVRQEAISLFHAFAAGVGYRDVSDRKLTREQADRWIKDSVADFTATLDRLASLSPAATQKDPADRSTGPLRDHDPVATAATPVSEAGGDAWPAQSGGLNADWVAMVLAEDARIEDGKLANGPYLAVKIAEAADMPAEVSRLRKALAHVRDHTRETSTATMAIGALAKPASSPAVGDVIETLVPLKWRHVDVEQFEAHSIIGTYEVCGQHWSFVPTLKKAGAEMGSLDEARKAAQSHRDMYGPQPRRTALSQSTSAGRGDSDAP